MRKIYGYLFLIYLVVLLTLLVIPTEKTGIKLNVFVLGIRLDHYIHATLFLPFLVFCRLLLDPKKFWIHLFIGIGFCSFCEGLHYFIPYREFSMDDFYANLSGMALGALIYRMPFFSRL